MFLLPRVYTGAAVANMLHVKRLKRGVAKWNAWRDTAGAPPDLRGANLSGAPRIRKNLNRANLHGADLAGADLSFTDLIDADLSVADLSKADLWQADLSGANLSDANLSDTILSHANLTRANLIDANLHSAEMSDIDLSHASLNGANLTAAFLCFAKLIGADLIDVDLTSVNLTCTDLSGANMTDVCFFYTVFCLVNLTNVIGLETCKHRGPSIIDHSTLQKSGPLPLPFLRGVGLSDRLIEYLPSLLGEAIQYYSCFISYSTKDQGFADRIHADLQNSGVRCWFAPHDLKIGDDLLDIPDAAIRVRDKVLLILSENSIGSGWVKKEVTAAFDEEDRRKTTVLFPVRIDDAVMETNEAWAAQLRHRLIGDFRHWRDHDGYKRSFERVLRDLKQITEPSK